MGLPPGADIWVELDADGVMEILHSPELVSVMQRAANKGAAAAKENAKDPEHIFVRTRPTNYRGAGRRMIADVVYAGGAKDEAHNGVLSRALGQMVVS